MVANKCVYVQDGLLPRSTSCITHTYLHFGREVVRNLWTDRPCPLDSLLRFRNDVASELVVSSYVERADDIVRAVKLLRQYGMAVGFPMQTADGEIIFSVGKDFTLTADQILELLEHSELDAEGVRRSVEAQASATPPFRRSYQ